MRSLTQASLKSGESFFSHLKLVAIFFAFFYVVFFISPERVFAADFSFSPASGTYTVGSTFTVRITISPGVDSVNAGDGGIMYDKNLMAISSFTKDGSVFSLWTSEPSLNTSAGTLSFSGGTPTAFSTNGTVLTLKMKALKVGTANISFTNGSILAADGKGTNVFGTSTPASYTITPAQDVAPAPNTASSDPSSTAAPAVDTGPPPAAPVIDSTTYPKEDAWYATSTGLFTWALLPDVTAVRVLLSQTASATPTIALQGLAASSTQRGIPDGISYFYVQYQNASGWGDVGKRKVQIDTIPPKTFDITLNTVGTNGPTLGFKAEDDRSGVDHYQLLIGSSSVATIQAKDMPDGTYPVPPQNGGNQEVTVRAFDMAGNMTEEKKTLNLPKVDNPNAKDATTAAPASGWGFDRILSIILAIVVGALIMWIRNSKKTTEQLRLELLKRIAEANDKNDRVFSAMREEFEQMINDFDPKPQLTPEERKLLEGVREVIDLAEELVSSSIDDLKKMVRGGS